MSSSSPPPDALLSSKHARYLLMILKCLPPSAAAYDSSRMTWAFFGLSGLDVLNRLKGKISLDEDQDGKLMMDAKFQTACQKWIHSLYVVDEKNQLAGFHGGTWLKTHDFGFLRPDKHAGHVAMTYTALACLRILGDDLKTLDREALLRGVRALQQKDGSFNSSAEGGENDMRFVYCAAAVGKLLNDDQGLGMDRDLAVEYILSSLTFEGGIAQGPHMEAHGGSTYCAVAALSLMDRLDALSDRQRRRLVRWCVNRLQRDDGFNGRPNKPADTCYSFWLGAALTILKPFGSDADADAEVKQFVGRSVRFVLETQDDVVGGLAKWIDNSSDPLHTYLGLGGLSLAGFEGLAELDPAVNVTKRALSD